MSDYNLDDPVELLCALTQINSVNSTLVPGAPGESEIADFIGKWFSDRDFDVTRLEGTPGRPSIVATSKGATTSKKIMLNGHIDTVTVASYDGDGCKAVCKDGNVYGFGDFIRGCFFLMSMCEKMGLGFDIDLSNHLLSNYVEGHSKNPNINYIYNEMDTQPNCWGHPGKNSTNIQKINYSNHMRKLSKEEQYSIDLVFIDGRFRVVCCLKCYDIIKDDCLIAFDDFLNSSTNIPPRNTELNNSY